jgi:hypothetical protein
VLAGGRRAPDRGGPQRAQEFGQLPAAQQVTRDGGLGLRKGLGLANAARAREGRPAIADREDHFHILHRGQRTLREVRHKAVQAFHKADGAERASRAARRRGRIGGDRVSAVHRWWRQAGAAWGRWAAHERAFARLRGALGLWAAPGELNARARAQRAGRCKGQSPYSRLGLVLPGGSWWELLNMPPNQLRERLSELNQAA